MAERMSVAREIGQYKKDNNMTILLIAEHDNAGLKSATGNALSAAQKIGGDIVILVAGPGGTG